MVVFPAWASAAPLTSRTRPRVSRPESDTLSWGQGAIAGPVLRAAQRSSQKNVEAAAASWVKAISPKAWRYWGKGEGGPALTDWVQDFLLDVGEVSG